MEYKYKWYIPDAYLHSRGTGYFTSHEGCAFINETGRDAHVRFTFYFQDREPMTGYKYFKSCLKNDDEMFWYFVIRFLAATGARVSELIQIKAEHVKLGHLDLYSKGGKLRRIYIPKELQNEALSWLADKQQESGFIFLNKYGERITTRGISGQLKKLAVKYGINPAVVYPHSFRHRFAKSFLDRCNDIAFLADLMGHESIETTRIYLRKTATEQREIVDTIIDW